MVDSNPSPCLGFARFSGGIAPSERIDHQIAGLGEEADEKKRKLNGIPGRMWLVSGFLAPFEVIAIRVVVAANDDIRRNRPSVVFEFFGDDFSGWPHFGPVSTFE